MSASEFVPKSKLFDELQTIFLKRNSAMLTLLTDTKKSVLMRFSEGRLTSARCRSWDVENTIEALVETETVKYSLMQSSVHDKVTLMEADEFWGMINPMGGPLETMVKLIPETALEITEPQFNLDGNLIRPPEDEAEKDPMAIDKAQAAKMNFF